MFHIYSNLFPSSPECQFTIKFCWYPGMDVICHRFAFSWSSAQEVQLLLAIYFCFYSYFEFPFSARNFLNGCFFCEENHSKLINCTTNQWISTSMHEHYICEIVNRWRDSKLKEICPPFKPNITKTPKSNWKIRKSKNNFYQTLKMGTKMLFLYCLSGMFCELFKAVLFCYPTILCLQNIIPLRYH